ncbi:hypothetical protein LXEBMM8_EKPBGFGD_02355 [Lactiplantibacillus xiangfangensis]
MLSGERGYILTTSKGKETIVMSNVFKVVEPTELDSISAGLGPLDDDLESGEIGYDIRCMIANSSWMKKLWHTNQDVC